MAKSKTRNFDPIKLKPFKSRDSDVTYAVIETPMGSRNKFKFDEKIGTYTLAGVLPQGMMFPHAFGFVPGTRAADGDPEDVLVVMDLPVFTGCVVPTRLLGVIEAEQTEDKKTVRNDRLIAVAENSRDYADINSLKDLNDDMLDEIEKFFVNYNEGKGKKFKVLGRKGPQQALKLLKKSIK